MKQMDKEMDFSDIDNELTAVSTQSPTPSLNDRGRANPVQPQLVRQETQEPVQFIPKKNKIKWGPGCGLQCKGNIKPHPPPPPPPGVNGGKRKKRGMKRTSKNSKKYKNKNRKKRHQTKRVIKNRNKLNNS
jgi:hypothetical protein